jgi:hypothetical protein
MSTFRLAALFATLLCMFAGGALRAQHGQQKMVEIKYVMPDTYKRATTTDAQGLTQWAEYDKPVCPTCQGKKTTVCTHCQRFTDVKKCIECNMKKVAPCRACAGLGYMPDPLEQVLCPGCMGAGFFPCFVCGGKGTMKIEGNGDHVFDCVACKGEGGFKCPVCNGERLVESAQVKPHLKDASVATLKKAQASVEEVLKAVDGFTPGGKDARRDVRIYNKLLTPAFAVLPPLKRCPKALDEIMGRIFMGSQFKGHEQQEADALQQWKSSNLYYLKHQKHLLDLCIERAESNAKVLAGKK